MSDYFITPNIVWKIKLSHIHCSPLKRTLYFLKSKWNLILYTNTHLVTIHLVPDTVPQNFSHGKLLITSGLKELRGILKHDYSNMFTIEQLRDSISIWVIEISNLLNENLLHGDCIHFVCKVEPVDCWELCLHTDRRESSNQTESSACVYSLCNDFSRLLLNPIEPDVQLKCQKVTLEAHRAILSCRSEVFAAMFKSSMREAREGIVEIEELQESVFAALIVYIYTGNIGLTSIKCAEEVFEAADRYAVESLRRRCVDYFKSNLNTQSALSVLELADTHVEPDLKKWVIDYIIEKKLLITKEWHDFSKLNPSLALDVHHVYLNKTRNVSTDS